MHVLIVDDWQFRHDWIRGVFAQGGVIDITFTSRYSPSEVTLDDLDRAGMIFLDHDMCKAPDGVACPNPVRIGTSTNSLNAGCGCLTGMGMVERIIHRGKPMRCVVHTANIPAGKRMTQALRVEGHRAVNTPAIDCSNLLPSTLLKEWGL